MRRPAISRSNFLSLSGVVCTCICLAFLFGFGGAARAQSLEKFTLKIDKKNPRKAPEKPTQTSDRTAVAGQTSSTSTQSPTATNDAVGSAPQTASSPSGCVYGTLLVKDTIRVIYIELINFPPNSAVPVTATQTNAGIIGFALTDTGPYTPTLNIVINTDSTGYGVSAPVFTQGQAVGQTVMYGDTPYGATTTIDFNVLPQCNCPPIPVVQ
jgi:hypothetical protein